MFDKSSVPKQIDTNPPILFVDNVLRATKLVHDVRRQRQIAKENKELLKRINKINRTQGFLGVTYEYRPKRFLNWESRNQEARRIKRENLVLLERILDVKPEIQTKEQESNYQNQVKYGKICTVYHIPKTRTIRKTTNDCRQRAVTRFYERTDRLLGKMTIEIQDSNVFNFLQRKEFNHIRGQIYRIYQGQYIVIRGHISLDHPDSSKKKILIENVRRGSLVKAAINDQPAILITLSPFRRLANCELLGAVKQSDEKMLDILDYYGTAYGRTKEPILFRLEIKPTGQ